MEFLQHFRQNYDIQEPGEITWGHGANSLTELTRYLTDEQTMFVEADIYAAPDGTPVMAHPPAAPGDETTTGTPIVIDKSGVGELTFENFIVLTCAAHQAIKLDFKSALVVEQCLSLLAKLRPEQPVMLHADILRAERAPEPHMGPAFIRRCRELYPDGILSIAWKTNPDVPYSRENIQAMRHLISDLDEVCISVRACMAQDSWEQMEDLISGHPGRLLHLWNNEIVTPEQLEWIKHNTDPRRTLYDLIDENKHPIYLNFDTVAAR